MPPTVLVNRRAPVVPPPDSVDIVNLRIEDAKVLVRLLRRVGGDPDVGHPRAAAAQLLDALRGALAKNGVAVQDSDYFISGGIQIEKPSFAGRVVYR